MDRTGLLYFGSDFCNGCATDSEHFGEKFLSELQCSFLPFVRFLDLSRDDGKAYLVG
jgi:hypothetical protein